jgi:hypothetical protein
MEISISGAHAFISHFISMATNFQKCLSFLEVHVHISKILEFGMTLSVTVAKRSNTPELLVL